MSKISFLFLTLLLLLVHAVQSVRAADEAHAKSTLGWDLSYRSVLKKNSIARDEWLAVWLRTHEHAPIKRILLNLTEQGILSSVLLEYPAFHAAERLAFLFVRTDDGAYCWNFVDGEPEAFVARPLDTTAYDSLVASLHSWEQREPAAERSRATGAPPGYFAFLSIYDHGVSKQILLTLEDFKVPKDPQWKNVEQGRVLRDFRPVIRLYD